MPFFRLSNRFVYTEMTPNSLLETDLPDAIGLRDGISEAESRSRGCSILESGELPCMMYAEEPRIQPDNASSLTHSKRCRACKVGADDSVSRVMYSVSPRSRLLRKYKAQGENCGHCRLGLS